MRTIGFLGALLISAAFIPAVTAQEPPATVAAPAPRTKLSPPAVLETGALPEAKAPEASVPAPDVPVRSVLSSAVERLASDAVEREAEERAAISAFYDARKGEPVWLAPTGLTPKGEALIAGIATAGDYGLVPADFALPDAHIAFPLAPEAAADAEATLMLAAMKYARFARGGRIMHPAQELSNYIDRGPQLIDPKAVLAAFADSTDIGATLRGFNPQHPQFERLRQVYLKLSGEAKAGKRGSAKGTSADARRVLANMEEWRWMPADMGEMYIWNNIPDFTQRVVLNGQLVRSEKIVTGEIGKQTPVLSRPLKRIAFRPKWKVPESIKVRELWPSLLRGGGLMRQYGLEVETKDGQPLDYRHMDWAKEDIRNYEVIQPPGGKSVLGVVKFSFPNQHTVYMHDTPDKYMFASAQRTFSHGCMRVKNPVQLAEIVLGYDQSMTPQTIGELIRSGPLNNEVEIKHRIPVHLTYFTAMVDDDGKLKTFRDVYGHEKRISLALEGRWSEIDRGRDALAPAEPDVAEANRAKSAVTRAAIDEELTPNFGLGGTHYSVAPAIQPATPAAYGAARRGAGQAQAKPQKPKSFDLLGQIFGGP